MRLSAPEQAVKALEDEGCRWVFGIPGTHTLELYDALERSGSLTPVLVTDEQSASFMADAVSRTTAGVGVVAVVPGAGLTHALSGVAEALLDGVPMVVLACAVRGDLGKAYQLHDIDQGALLRAVTKGSLRPASPSEVYSCLRRAVRLARSGCPGPVAVEIPAEYYLAPRAVEVSEVPPPSWFPPGPSREDLRESARLLAASRRPLLYAGNGARGASAALVELAERLGAPVVTTIQGKGVFPESRPLWLWNVLGQAAPPFVRRIVDGRDCMLAVGCRFGEVATASYGASPPAELIHVDIDASVFHRNYPARLAVESDARAFLEGLLPLIAPREPEPGLAAAIAEGRRGLHAEGLSRRAAGKVAPAVFFEALQRAAGEEALFVTDSGQGTFLALEHLRLSRPGGFIGPVDYSCMGYSVPAAVAAKLASPERPVIALTGDGALLMTGLELLTASFYGAAPVICVLRDGELGQIAQFQRRALGRESCSALAPYEVEDLARLARCDYLRAADDGGVAEVLGEALAASARGRPVLVEVAMDPRPTHFTRGVLAANWGRLPWPDRARLAARALGRRLAARP